MGVIAMKRVLAVLLLFWCAVSSCLTQARAGDRRYPPRYQRGSYADYIVRKKDGKTEVRQVYSGYANRFPPPAFLYYGYPHSGDGTGIGPLDRK
jgi:hypothetical protein